MEFDPTSSMLSSFFGVSSEHQKLHNLYARHLLSPLLVCIYPFSISLFLEKQKYVNKINKMTYNRFFLYHLCKFQLRQRRPG